MQILSQKKKRDDKLDDKKTKQKERKSIRCRYDQRGYCRDGEKCNYQHKEHQEDLRDKENRGTRVKDRKNNIDCIFYKRGKCRNEENCEYRHRNESKNMKWGVQNHQLHSQENTRKLLAMEKKKQAEATERIVELEKRMGKRRPDEAKYGKIC